MRRTTPHFMAYFGVIFFANMGVGVVRIIFMCAQSPCSATWGHSNGVQLSLPFKLGDAEIMILHGFGAGRCIGSLSLEQPQDCTGTSLGCSRARDIVETLRPSPQKTTFFFPYRFPGGQRHTN